VAAFYKTSSGDRMLVNIFKIESIQFTSGVAFDLDNASSLDDGDSSIWNDLDQAGVDVFYTRSHTE